MRAVPSVSAALRRVPPESIEAIGQTFPGSSGSTSSPPPVFATISTKAPQTRLDHRDAVRHRFEQEHTFRLVVGRRHRQHIEALQKRELSGAVHHPAVRELAGQTLLSPSDAGERRPCRRWKDGSEIPCRGKLRTGALAGTFGGIARRRQPAHAGLSPDAMRAK